MKLKFPSPSCIQVGVMAVNALALYPSLSFGASASYPERAVTCSMNSGFEDDQVGTWHSLGLFLNVERQLELSKNRDSRLSIEIFDPDRILRDSKLMQFSRSESGGFLISFGDGKLEKIVILTVDWENLRKERAGETTILYLPGTMSEFANIERFDKDLKDGKYKAMAIGSCVYAPNDLNQRDFFDWFKMNPERAK